MPGSFIELSDQDLEAIARAEHTRWYERRLAGGWSADEPARRANGSGRAMIKRTARANARVNSRVVPWGDLPADERNRGIDYLRSQLMQLEDVGFVPVVPPGGPPEAAEFRRIRNGPGPAAARPPPLDAPLW